jgi:hypothetical protein
MRPPFPAAPTLRLRRRSRPGARWALDIDRLHAPLLELRQFAGVVAVPQGVFGDAAIAEVAGGGLDAHRAGAHPAIATALGVNYLNLLQTD